MKVIKIGAIWCSGCLVMKPIWKEIEKENTWLETKYYDIDDDTDEIQHHNIDVQTMPTFIFLDKNNKELERLTGEIKKEKLLEIINKYKGK